jgi:hypothetical protein
MDKSKLIRYGAITFLILIILELLAYFGFLSLQPGFLVKYGWWILYLDLSIIFLGLSVYYVLSNRSRAPCMTGMMMGMTIGMQTGMMIGAVVGATNGFFTGSMVGMILGSIAGVLAGRASKSTMSWLQGLMAGIMGGTMGPMISVMMFTDHIAIFMPFYFILNIIVLLGFIKMYHEEIIEGNKELVHKKIDLLTFVSACILVAFIIIVIMIYGPKAGLFI